MALEPGIKLGSQSLLTIFAIEPLGLQIVAASENQWTIEVRKQSITGQHTRALLKVDSSCYGIWN
ncbi:hypothetical protein [uncultured Vibrio sp.]|uniref:hypothetical protein n=1 Tax=uncultured Vibrio sp. TaxID=114054 RepID=UPI0029C731B1|nr:hypothetical protein [uncultured Vibrio sp.]